MISSLLQRVGVIGCEIALSGQEAIAKVAEQPYDIIFMDHLMPGMSGVETAMTLKAQYPANAPVIVAVTANPAWALGDTLFAAGMDDYLSKPLDAARLTQCLRKWLPANDTSETDSSSK